MKSKSSFTNHLGIFPCIAAVALFPSVCLAADHTWDGGGATASWIDYDNWDVTTSGFGIGSTQTFNTSSAGNLATLVGTSPNVGTLNFNADADNSISIQLTDVPPTSTSRDFTFTVSAGNAAINVDSGAAGNITLGVGGGSFKLSNPLVITHDGTGNLTIDRPIVLTTAGTLLGITKAGTGTLTLAAANTFDGGLTLAAGTLNINNAAATGSTAGTFTINGGFIDNTTSPAAAVNLGARALSINGDFTFKGSAGSTATLNLGTGATNLGISAGTTRTITVTASTLTIAGIIADGTTANGITKNGNGVLGLNGKSTFTGPILVNSGSLSTATTTTFTSSGLTVGGPTATGSPALVGSGSLNIPTIFASAGIGGVVGTEQPGGTTAGGTHTFTNTVTYDSGAVFAWQVNTVATNDPGANTDNYGTFDKVVANGAAGSVTGGAAVFRISIAASAFTDAFWDTNKTWSGIFTGPGIPAALASVFPTFAGTSVDANGYVAGQGQFTFVGSTLKWTAGVTPANAYDLWSTGLANPAFDFDSDADGLTNGLEWVLGGNASQNDNPSVLPLVTGNATTGLVLAFTREEDAIAETTVTVEYAPDLSGPWTEAVIDQDGGSFPNGVVVTINEAASPDTVTVNIPASNGVGGKLFARLRATRN